jgi:hypothetical protein
MTVLSSPGERKSESEKKEKDYFMSEREYGAFYRRLPLPTAVDPSTASAKIEDGVLTVTARRTEPRPRRRRSRFSKAGPAPPRQSARHGRCQCRPCAQSTGRRKRTCATSRTGTGLGRRQLARRRSLCPKEPCLDRARSVGFSGDGELVFV